MGLIVAKSVSKPMTRIQIKFPFRVTGLEGFKTWHDRKLTLDILQIELRDNNLRDSIFIVKCDIAGDLQEFEQLLDQLMQRNLKILSDDYWRSLSVKTMNGCTEKSHLILPHNCTGNRNTKSTEIIRPMAKNDWNEKFWIWEGILNCFKTWKWRYFIHIIKYLEQGGWIIIL